MIITHSSAYLGSLKNCFIKCYIASFADTSVSNWIRCFSHINYNSQSPEATHRKKTLSLPCVTAKVWLWLLTVVVTLGRKADKGKNTLIILIANNNTDQL